MTGLNGNGDAVMSMNHIELRDWFAGHALAGILSNSQYPAQGSGEPFDQFSVRIAERAFGIAEAMMKQSQNLKKETASTW